MKGRSLRVETCAFSVIETPLITVVVVVAVVVVVVVVVVLILVRFLFLLLLLLLLFLLLLVSSYIEGRHAKSFPWFLSSALLISSSSLSL